MWLKRTNICSANTARAGASSGKVLQICKVSVAGRRGREAIRRRPFGLPLEQARLTREIFGNEVIYVPWQRPGFDIGLLIESLIKDHPRATGVLLGHHGMSSWSKDDKTCYETALEIIDRAAQYIEARDRGELTFGGQQHQALPEADRRRVWMQLLPWLRGQLSAHKRVVATVQDDTKTLRFVDSVDGPRLAELGTSGRSCPDHSR